METQDFDVVIIGGGPLGLATAYHLSKRKCSTLVLEQFTFGNQLGSSAGVSRQFRIPYPDAYMVKLVKQSVPFWHELENLTPVPLRETVGTLWFGDPAVQSTEGNIKQAEAALKEEGVAYQLVNQEQLEQAYHFKDLPSNYVGLFQDDGASINLKATQQTLYDWNTRSPYVTLKEEAPATSIEHRDGKFQVTTPKGMFTAGKLVLVPGPYADEVFQLLGFGVAATYWNMASAFYKTTGAGIVYPTWFVFQNPVGENGNQFYGFPEVSWNYPGYVRVASDFVMAPLSSPGQRSAVPNPRELGFTAAWVAQHMTGLEPTPRYTSTCMVALSKIRNKEMLIDFAPASVPAHRDVVICATGWAGKFVPLLGSILADLATDGHTRFDISHFATGPEYFIETGKTTS